MRRVLIAYRSFRRGGIAGLARLLRDRLGATRYDLYRFDLSRPVPAIAGADGLRLEIGKLSRLRAWVRTGHGVPPPYLESGRDPALAFCWALSGDQPVGINWMGVSSPLIRVAPGEAIIMDVYTDPRWRGRGVAKALEAVSCRFLKERGFKFVYTTVRPDNVASCRVQEALGFVHVGGFTSRGLFKTRPATTQWTQPGRATSAV